MSLIPLKQTVTVQKPGGLDEWGRPIPGETAEYKCRIDEGAELVRGANGEEVVSSARILIAGLVDVAIEDTVTYTNELGDAYSADRKSTRLNSSHVKISYAVFCLNKKNQ